MDDSEKVVTFPSTDEERKALRKEKQDQEKQKLINLFVDETNGLYHTPNEDAYADLIINGHRETWPVRSKKFRIAYIQYLERERQRFPNSLIAVLIFGLLNKTAINEAIDYFEMKAIASETEREVHLRVASDSGDLYVDLCDRDWRALRITGSQLASCGISAGSLSADFRNVGAAGTTARHSD